MSAPNIRSFEPVVPMIYAYSHPDYTPHLGWTKIGYTEKQSVEERVKQQHHTSDIAYKILWRDNITFLSSWQSTLSCLPANAIIQPR